MTMPIPAQERVEAAVARLSAALRTRTVKPSLRWVVAFPGFSGSAHATGTATPTMATATTSPAGPPSSPASPGPASAAAVKVRASSRLARGSAGPATAGS
ncbi:hypothetical protein MUY14_24860 [Amycolatopsis sp. FBCC-B4732]|uniref:hypothetical protein n=1 Tax=Amycolatopsis sp. FBCC-B4732 TaxID=3079339 RepID=UPI001FF20196|nr:hypothetical protein [Amycolatopsis sp. FBCC-B4732]UOX85036.1 hypothetical protein MUY14_24860 [Amycolatopsis sp. FBCC-B4732]